MGTRMTAVQLSAHNAPYRIKRDIAKPLIHDPYDLIVKIAAASYCHTDSMVQAGVFRSKCPLVPAHEGAGTVTEVGSQAQSAGWKVGDRVMCGIPVGLCGECEECTGPPEQRHYCKRTKGGVGISIDGFMAEYTRCDSRSATRLPDNISFINASPLSCAGRTIWRAINIARRTNDRNSWIALVGSGGGLGHLGVQFAKAMGLKVIGIDAKDEGLELSRELGADLVLDARHGKENLVKQLLDATTGKLAGSTVCISDHPSAIGIACAVTRLHGTVVQVGQPDVLNIPFPELIFRDIRLRGSLTASPAESVEMLEFVSRHDIQARVRVFEGLDRIHELVEAVEKGQVKGKAVILVDRSQMEESLVKANL